MDLTPIIERLRAQLSGFKAIGSAADLDALGVGVVPTPSCYVIPANESAEDVEVFGGFEQRILVGFSVIITATNLCDARGVVALHGLEPSRQVIKAALNGWAPDAQVGEPVRFASGALLRFDDGLLWWADDYRVVTYERNV